jgi:hypothetical protein
MVQIHPHDFQKSRNFFVGLNMVAVGWLLSSNLREQLGLFERFIITSFVVLLSLLSIRGLLKIYRGLRATIEELTVEAKEVKFNTEEFGTWIEQMKVLSDRAIIAIHIAVALTVLIIVWVEPSRV